MPIYPRADRERGSYEDLLETARSYIEDVADAVEDARLEALSLPPPRQ